MSNLNGSRSVYGEIQRFREISDSESASSESESCMHCDCRAADNCRLRDIANEFSIKDPKGKIVNSPIAKENKCIIPDLFLRMQNA